MPSPITLGLICLLAGPPVDEPADPVAAIQRAYASDDAAFRKATSGLDPKDEASYLKLLDDLLARRQASFAAALELARRDPASEVGFASLEWIARSAEGYGFPSAEPGFRLLAEHHPAHPKIGPAIATLGYHCPDAPPSLLEAAVGLIRAVAAKNPSREVRAQAEMGLAWQVAGKHYRAEMSGAPETPRLASETVARLEELIRDHGDCPSLRALGRPPSVKTVADEANLYLDEIRKVGIGNIAPEIRGPDLDGVGLKLSDHRGKVVMLVFWASWCGPCMADVPHEREIARRFQGRPFALIGVSGDADAGAARRAVASAEIPWRSFRGDDGGTIVDSWGVVGLPKVFVIDDLGVIREKHLRGGDLDGPLEKLVSEAEGRRAKP